MSNLTSGHNQKLILWLLASFFLIVSTITLLFLAQSDEPNLYVTITETYYILDEGESTLVTFEASQELGAFTYTSNDTSVVQFVENRLISVGTGSTTITVSSQSKPSVFQTVSVIVRPKDVEPEAPLEPGVPSQPEPEVPVDVEPELPEDPEPEAPVNPVDPDDSDDEVVTPPTIYTITITNETGAVITTLQLEEGSFITTSGLDLPETFKGFYLEGETCSDDPFDLETPITENLTLIQASFNDQAPCLQLDYIVLSGRPVAGTELTIDIFPIGANVTISWYTSVNNRTYREIPGESGSTFTVRPEDSGKFIRVYVVSDSNPPVVRFDTLKLDVFGTVSDSSGTSSGPTRIPLSEIEIASAAAISNAGMIPIAYPEDLLAVNSGTEHDFAGELVTEGGLNKSYVLIRNINFSDFEAFESAIITGTFTGNISGMGFSISNVNISGSATSMGLFEKLQNATIENLTLAGFIVSNSGTSAGILAGEVSGHVVITDVIVTNASIMDASNVGGLIGALLDTNTILTLSGITVDGEIKAKTGSGRTGGLIGNDNDSTSIINISNSFNHSTVIGLSSNYIGGFIGYSKGTIHISQSINFGTITGPAPSQGGFVGHVIGTVQISQSVNVGTITGEAQFQGGFVGNGTNTSEITIHDSYNLGSIYNSLANNVYMGGFVGASSNKFVLTNSYNAGAIIRISPLQDDEIGALIGRSPTDITVTASYYLSGTAISGSGLNSDLDNRVKSKFNLVFLNTFSSDWNIEAHPTNSGIWSIGFNGEYTFPYLTFQGAPYPDQIPDFNDDERNTLLLLSRIYEENFIPIASKADLDKMKGTPDTVFASGTVFEGAYTPGADKKFMLVADINLEAYISTVFTGTFYGTFDGNGYEIFNLKINNASSSSGFFQSLENATIKNLMINSFNITGSLSNYGFLAGVSEGNVKIENVHVTNSSISAWNNLGGLIGRHGKHNGTQDTLEVTNYSFSGSIESTRTTPGYGAGGGVVGAILETSYVTFSGIHIAGHITSDFNLKLTYFGGLAGYVLGTLHIYNSINLAQITAYEQLGGFIGAINGSGIVTINESINLGHVSGPRRLGGFIGDIINGTTIIRNSFNRGTISRTGNDTNGYAGGLIGVRRQPASLEIFNSYSASVVTEGSVGTSKIDALISDKPTTPPITATAVYYDSDLTSQFNPSGYTDSPEQFSTNDKSNQNIFIGFDFDAIWVINTSKNGGYPYLRWAEAIIPDN